MALATLPPAVEIVEAFKSGPECLVGNFLGPGQNLSVPYWAIFGPSQQSPWKLTAFSKISMLKNTGKAVPGLGARFHALPPLYQLIDKQPANKEGSPYDQYLHTLLIVRRNRRRRL